MMLPSRKKGRYIVKSPDGEVEELFDRGDVEMRQVEEYEEARYLSKFD